MAESIGKYVYELTEVGKGLEQFFKFQKELKTTEKVAKKINVFDKGKNKEIKQASASTKEMRKELERAGVETEGIYKWLQKITKESQKNQKGINTDKKGGFIARGRSIARAGGRAVGGVKRRVAGGFGLIGSILAFAGLGSLLEALDVKNTTQEGVAYLQNRATQNTFSQGVYGKNKNNQQNYNSANTSQREVIGQFSRTYGSGADVDIIKDLYSKNPQLARSLAGGDHFPFIGDDIAKNSISTEIASASGDTATRGTGFISGLLKELISGLDVKQTHGARLEKADNSAAFAKATAYATPDNVKAIEDQVKASGELKVAMETLASGINKGKVELQKFITALLQGDLRNYILFGADKENSQEKANRHVQERDNNTDYDNRDTTLTSPAPQTHIPR